MPNHEEHCQDSLRRYGKTFSELHKWMDEPSTILGPRHRKYRHDPNTTPKVARQLFGPLADQACLDHIRLDELERRKKGIGKIRISVRKARQTELQHPLFYAFWALMSLIIGFMLFSQSYIGGSAIFGGAISIFFSFLLFLLFLGSLSRTTEKETASGRTFNIEPPIHEVFKTCPNCGTSFEAKLKNCPNCGTESN